ncbi:hypothetical protein Ndes2526B_g04701 [Nannochloris sp. 'desiccata']|nr:hypothetical protein NADE_003392 [Chlorella desiccata (nom. nud.)]
MNGPEEPIYIWEGLMDCYDVRRATVDLPEEQQDKNAFPYRSWQGWANIAEDMAIASDFPAFRARQAVKIALQASEDNIKGRIINSIDIDAAIVAILSGDVPATQLPNTQQMEHEQQRVAPIIVLDEQKRRGKRSEYNYLVMFPGQSQEQGEWFSKGQLKTNFASTWKSMLDTWKLKKGGGAIPSGEEDTATVGGSVQAGGAAADGIYIDGDGGGEHQASVIQGEFYNPENMHIQDQQQHQLQRQQVPDRLPSPLLLPEPKVPLRGSHQGRVTRDDQLAQRVQLYSQPEEHVRLLPLPSGDGGVFLPAAAAAISPSGPLQWLAAEQLQNNELMKEPPGSVPRVSHLLPLGATGAASGAGYISKRPRAYGNARRPLAPSVVAAVNKVAHGTRAPLPLVNGVRVHPLLRNNVEYAQKQQANQARHPKKPPPRRTVEGVSAAARNAVQAAGEAAAIAALETLNRRETNEEVEERKRRRKVMPGPSRDPKSREPEGATPIRITAAAAAPTQPIAEEEEEEEDDVEIIHAPMPLPDTEDEGGEELEEEKTEDTEEKKEEEEEELADFEKETYLSDEEKERRKTLRIRLQPEMWADAKLTGAKHTGQDLELFVVWNDGFKENFPSKWLLGPKLIHCMYTLIAFYESKTTKKSAKAPTNGGGGSKEVARERSKGSIEPEEEAKPEEEEAPVPGDELQTGYVALKRRRRK